MENKMQMTSFITIAEEDDYQRMLFPPPTSAASSASNPPQSITLPPLNHEQINKPKPISAAEALALPGIIKSRTFIPQKVSKRYQSMDKSQKNFKLENIFVRDEQLELEVERNEDQEIVRMNFKQSEEQRRNLHE